MRLKKDANEKLCYYSSYVTYGESVSRKWSVTGGGEDAGNFSKLHYYASGQWKGHCDNNTEQDYLILGYNV